ncbi:GDP-L-fucose synthase [Chloracidobacterium thermophilum]|uniref:GDP-L-fucose synthase family protein n=1 Tax=Chloracidobacterium thermophilum TaxID=458033 RepID=UPI000738B352|nr:GDP-L-fucose synthase [Chloracidobacterium thermophilum]
MEKDAKIYVAGHRGLVGSAIVRRLRAEGFTNLLLRTRTELDLTRQTEVEAFFAAERPAYVFLAAAKVGGILANDTYGGDFIRDNLLIQTHVIEAARQTNVQKLLFLGSSCIYPKFAPQPMPENCLLTGILEPTNEPYAVAKIAGLTMVKAYRKQYGFNGISLMPTNLYGPGDNFDLTSSHALAALLRKFHEARLTSAPAVTVWGTGKPRREFLHVDDLADAALFLMQRYESEDPINVGVGEDISIGELAMIIRDIVGYTGDIVYDTAKPDGTPRKLLDVSRLHALGWQAQIGLREGIAATYAWYCAHYGG